MKLIQHNEGVVTHIFDTVDGTTVDNIAVVENIPAFEIREGYNGVLKYSTEIGLYWDYVEPP